MALSNCPECNGNVSDAARTCPHCGYPLMAFHQAHPTIPPLLSLVLPGSGQVLKGQTFMGLFFLFITVVFYLLFLPAGMLIHFLSIIDAAWVDPAKGRLRKS